jgi:hypothetical protein
VTYPKEYGGKKIQKFDDFNKRTSRVASNIPLLKADLAPMSFLTMDDRAYMTSPENYRTLRAELETPEKAALVYCDFVRYRLRPEDLAGIRREWIEHWMIYPCRLNNTTKVSAAGLLARLLPST